MHKSLFDQQYYLNKLSIDGYVLKKQYSPKSQLCIIGLEQWAPELRVLGNSIVSALKQYCEGFDIQFLNNPHEISQYEPTMLLLSESTLTSIQQNSAKSYFVMEQLAHNPSMKKQFWQCCCDA